MKVKVHAYCAQTQTADIHLHHSTKTPPQKYTDNSKVTRAKWYQHKALNDNAGAVW